MCSPLMLQYGSTYTYNSKDLYNKGISLFCASTTCLINVYTVLYIATIITVHTVIQKWQYIDASKISIIIYTSKINGIASYSS